MSELKRLHETTVSVIIYTSEGAQEREIDISKLSDEELYDLMPNIPQAAGELIYRSLAGPSGTKDEQ
jgi:hypothetical protein